MSSRGGWVAHGSGRHPCRDGSDRRVVLEAGLVREIARHTQRIQKTLEDANVKRTEMISDILGTSGRAILTALVAGETDPARLVDLTSGRAGAPLP